MLPAALLSQWRVSVQPSAAVRPVSTQEVPRDRREALARAAGSLTRSVPEAGMRNALTGARVLQQLVNGLPESGYQAYARQLESYRSWQEAAKAEPVRSAVVVGFAERKPLLDLRL